MMQRLEKKSVAIERITTSKVGVGLGQVKTGVID